MILLLLFLTMTKIEIVQQKLDKLGMNHTYKDITEFTKIIEANQDNGLIYILSATKIHNSYNTIQFNIDPYCELFEHYFGRDVIKDIRINLLQFSCGTIDHVHYTRVDGSDITTAYLQMKITNNDWDLWLFIWKEIVVDFRAYKFHIFNDQSNNFTYFNEICMNIFNQLNI
jgi:hypothetical protein